MTPTAMAFGLLVALGVLAVVLNHCYARIALVELTLNEGLPPGHQNVVPETVTVDERSALGSGLHIFVSRTCHACQRLMDELASAELELPSDLYLRYVDRPRPFAHDVAGQHGATLIEQQLELSQTVGADPLPFTIAVGHHDLVGRSVTPTLAAVLETARNAGLDVQVQPA